MSNLSIFNEVLNLFRERYSCFITREEAEKKIMKDEDLYKKDTNKEKINKFIKFYNSLESNKNTLSFDNKLYQFFIDDSNKDNNNIGQSYIDIYNKFIEIQNKAVKPLLDIKIENDIFDINCIKEVNIQNVKEQFNYFSDSQIYILDHCIINRYQTKLLNVSGEIHDPQPTLKNMDRIINSHIGIKSNLHDHQK